VNGLRLKLFSFSVRGELVEPQKNTFARASSKNNIDDLVKSRHSGENRSPENLELSERTGFRRLPRTRSGVRRNDKKGSFQTFYEFINFGLLFTLVVWILNYFISVFSVPSVRSP
jgi:hypothetical protein